jgi:hypothetical protein
MTGSSSVPEFKSIPPLFPPINRPSGDAHRLGEFFSVHWNIVGIDLSNCRLIRHSLYRTAEIVSEPELAAKDPARIQGSRTTIRFPSDYDIPPGKPKTTPSRDCRICPMVFWVPRLGRPIRHEHSPRDRTLWLRASNSTANCRWFKSSHDPTDC